MRPVWSSAILLSLLLLLSAAGGLAATPTDAEEEWQADYWLSAPPPGKGKGGGGGGGGGDPPAQPAQSTPWGVQRLAASSVWSASTGAGINVAVFDSGIDASHPDLKDNVAGGVNFACKSTKKCNAASWDDANGHGTHVAGTIAAADNTIGVVGVAPGATLWAYKVLDNRGSGSWSWLISGLEHATATHDDSDSTNDIHVISMSLSASSYPSAVQTAINDAADAGIIIVAAAGNSGDGSYTTNEIEYPAALNDVISVGATGTADTLASFSSTNAAVDYCGPGVSIPSTAPDGGYATASGTSMATPHVSGAIAVILASAVGSYDADADGEWDTTEVLSALSAGADDIGPAGHDNGCGDGLVDLGDTL